MDFVNEQDHAALAAGDIAYHVFEPLLEFAFVFGTGHQGGHVQGIDFFAFEAFGDIGPNNALGNAFRNGGFSDPGFANQQGIVLGSAGQNLNNPTNFIVPTDDGV